MMPLSDQTGELVGYLKILRDRTQQRLAEDALRDREAFLSSVLASSGDCIQVLDLDGRLSFMTEAGQKVMEVGDFGVLCGISWPTLWTEAARGEAQKGGRDGPCRKRWAFPRLLPDTQGNAKALGCRSDTDPQCRGHDRQPAGDLTRYHGHEGPPRRHATPLRPS